MKGRSGSVQQPNSLLLGLLEAGISREVWEEAAGERG